MSADRRTLPPSGITAGYNSEDFFLPIAVVFMMDGVLHRVGKPSRRNNGSYRGINVKIVSAKIVFAGKNGFGHVRIFFANKIL